MSEGSPIARVLSLTHGQVCYLQLPAADGARAAAFYAAVFGWDIEEHTPDFVAPGLIGQWVPGRPPAPEAGPMLWLHVSDLDETLARVTAPRSGVHGCDNLHTLVFRLSQPCTGGGLTGWRMGPKPPRAIPLQAERAQGSCLKISWLHVIL
jgi:hypothetical protein